MQTGPIFKNSPNCFGYERTSPLAVFSEEHTELRAKIRQDAIRYLFEDKAAIFDEIEAQARQEIEQYSGSLAVPDIELLVERRLHFSQHQNGFVHNRVKERCFRIKKQLVSALQDQQIHFGQTDRLIDVGAGSGLNAQLLMQELQLNYTFLTDVVDYRYAEIRSTRGIDFKLFRAPYTQIEAEGQFQLGIITNTLHHCDQPFEVFQAMTEKMAPGSILLVIESCVGVTRDEVAGAGFSTVIPFQTLYRPDGSIDPYQDSYLALNDADKMLYGIFFDWIYNRVFLNENINVPYNFGKPADWNRHFENCGYKVLQTYLMGFDQPAALEFHTLHVLKRDK